MKYWAHKVFVRIAQLIALSILTCAVPAFAQFEVSPDHFDSSPKIEKKQAAKTSVKKTGALSAKITAQDRKDQSQIILAKSSARRSSAAAGQSQGSGISAATTNAAAAKPKKRGPASKVVLASAQ